MPISKARFPQFVRDSSHYEVSIRENILLGDIGTEDEERMKNAINKSRMSSVIENCPDGSGYEFGGACMHPAEIYPEESGSGLAIARLL